ncbi:TnsA endonuclease N-terminal domain-containing protein [Halobacillus ihumii]|uniref:TnsA endonuclease N-terminal domain-containing protein n=1 Tax=Halobacillus ihumii TaxID=2686092 RepID=UPI001F084C35|nr:TnsA endonuclease N-terminal domain-containing protein [Halobacillus ihumii]
MAKRKNTWTEDKIARYYSEGRGSGELGDYKPWLNIHDVSSSGRSLRVMGWKTSRIHHLLSDLERNYFYLLEWADEVIDIREQYPLDREITHQIAENKQINHPTDKTTKTPIVLTTDFFITLRKGREISYIARTVKPSGKLDKSRVIQKFEIERAYWKDRHVDWGIVTEKDLPVEMVGNIGWFHSAYELPAPPDNELIPELYGTLQQSKDPIGKTLRQFDESYHLEKGSALALFKHLLARKKVLFNVKERFSVTWNTSTLTFPVLDRNEEGVAT